MTVTAELGEAEVDAPGFFCSWKEACGNADLLPEALGGTFAVSFLLSAESETGATDGTPATEGAFGKGGEIDADGIVPGAFGTIGGGAANEGGFGTPGATPAPEGGFGAGGAIPAIEGGLGARGGVVKPEAGATGGIPGGFGRGGAADDSSPEGDNSGGTGF